MKYKKIIFVSLENSFTSPVAEVIMKEKLKDYNIEVESRGMVVLFREPANPKGVAIAKCKGLNLDKHKAKQIKNNIFNDDVLVLVMTEKIKINIYEKYINAVNVYTIKEFVGGDGDIESPFGKGMKDYGDSYNIIEELMDEVVQKLFKMDT